MFLNRGNMSLKKITLFLFLCLMGHVLSAQSAYWVFFTDKNNTTFDPYTYFDAYAIERRIQNNISLYDTTDFPLNEAYVNETASLSEEVIGETRWFNALAVFATDKNISQIQALPFVKEIIPIETDMTVCSYQMLTLADNPPPEEEEEEEEEIDDESDYITSSSQVKRMDGDLFIQNNIDGKGIRIAVFDAGFPDVNTHPAFEHIRNENRIIKTWNFCNKKEDVYGNNSHGRMVLSCIAGMYDGKKTGLATGAEFLLARTEFGLEIKKEEVWWMMAVEWADKHGAHIINSSLGYGGERYHPKHLDGKTILVTRAANMAASKGILVVNAAGNEGTDKLWKQTIIAPADADSILSIGGISPSSDFHIYFSSIGPTADGRLKPNVVAWGEVTVAGNKDQWQCNVTGTSFASPLVAGFAACAWQLNRDLNNMELKAEIERSGDLYPYYDYHHGYGVPQASYFLEDTSAVMQDASILIIEEEEQEIIISVDKSKEQGAYWDRKYPNLQYLYYHIENEEGRLVKYMTLDLPNNYFSDDSDWENFFTDMLSEDESQIEKKDEGETIEEVVSIEEDIVEEETIPTAEELETDVRKEVEKTDGTESTKEEIVVEEEIPSDEDNKRVVARIGKSELKSGYTLRVRYNGIVKEYSNK